MRTLGAIGDETWLYFVKMRALGAPPLAPAVPLVYKTCSAGNLSGSDDVYFTRCTVPWIEVNAQPTAQTAQAVFAKAHFDYCKRYITEALRNKPSASAGNRAKLFWLLDVMTVGTLALIDLNIPIVPATRRGRSTAHAPRSILTPFLSARDNFDRYAGLARGQLIKPTTRDDVKREIQAAEVMPGPFTRLPLSWVNGDILRRGPDPIYERIYKGYVPMANGYQVASVGNKDGAEIARASMTGDLPLIQAIQQWRLWCVRDGVSMPAGFDASLNPLHWGTATNQVTLGKLIESVVKSESNSPGLVLEVVGGRPRLYPNLAYAFQNAPAILNPLLSMDYGMELRAHVSNWIAASTPKAGPDGQPAVDGRGALVPQPVSFTDYALMVKGDAAAATAMARAAITNPELGCKGNKTCLEWVRGKKIAGDIRMPSQAEINQMIMATPLGLYWKAMQVLADFFVKAIGGAVAGGRPFYPIEQPFVRSFTSPDYRTVPDDSSVMVLARVLSALQNLEQLTGIDLCTQCPGAAIPPPAVTPTATPRSSTPGPIVDDCAERIDSYLGTRPLLRLTPAQRQAVISLCQREVTAGDPPFAAMKLITDLERAQHAASTVVVPPKKSKVVPVAAGVSVAATAAWWILRFMR